MIVNAPPLRSQCLGTPDPETGAGNWTDDQFPRGIREGGRLRRPRAVPVHALFGFPRVVGRRLSVDHRLPADPAMLPVRKQRPTTQLIFPVNYLIRSVPQPLEDPVPEPDVSTPEKRGKYLVTILGGCGCHTPTDDHGQPLLGL